jgi:DNA polymerase-3 subunit alpha
VHLHAHSHYSLLEATIQPKALAAAAAEMGMPAVAMTDYGNMFGAIEFYFAAQAVGVKPIVGLEVYIAPKSRLVKGEDKEASQMPNRRLVLLAKDFKGYQSLCQLSSIGYKEGFYYRPRVDYEVLSQFNQNVIALSSGEMGEVAWSFTNKGEEAAEKALDKLLGIYGDDFYLESNRTGVKVWDEINPFLKDLSQRRGVPLVATNNVHYLKRDDQLAQEVLICIGSNKTLQDDSRYRLGSDQFYFKSSEEMKALYADMPEAISNTLDVANKCNIEFKLKDAEGKPIYHLPKFPTSEGLSEEDEMEKIAKQGLERRFAEAEARGETVAEEQKPRYFERLAYELDIIGKMGFVGYFLIVQDFINWAKDHDIPVGPGRGSGAGSLVAYCLFITDLDPMPYNLIFERFLNPERISMPDFDIDFCQENRYRVIDYVTEKYGQGSVSQIITYGKLQARAAVRDVGRVLGMTFSEVDVVAKLIPDKLGITLDEAIEMEPRIPDLMDIDPKIKSLMDLARGIEGLVRHAGIHAAGVIIADGQLIDHAPLYRGVDGENVVQYDMKHSEKIGLIKFDFLGLKTLTHINEAIRLVRENREKQLSTKDISLSDVGIYSIMSKGDTAGIFQFEGEGITDLIKKAKPTCFEDIVALNALYRPGPMDMIPSYLDRKHGRVKVDYLFPELEEILKETYGIVIYQEQVQLIAAKIASYSLGEADMLRRAMGKKIAEEMAKQKTRFMKGAEDNSFERSKSEELFETMAEFAKYGFNKSHAAAYCVVAAQTAWLKNYYPVEFFAALLSTEMSDTDKVVKYVKDAQQHNIEVLPPHISHSSYKFTVKGDKIFFSLGAIKGVGQSAVEAIVEARKEKPEGFETLEEFFKSVDLRKVNKKTIECLIKSGAFDGYGFNRAELIEGYPQLIERSERQRKDREVGQGSLFMIDESTSKEEGVRLERKEPWGRSFRLSAEKEVLGFYLSDHPLKGLESVAKVFSTGPVSGLVEKNNKDKIQIVGLITTMREIVTKKGTRMAFAGLEDLSGTIELIVFPDAYKDYELVLKEDGPLVIGGTLEKEEESLKIFVDEVKRIEDIYKRTKSLSFHLKQDMASKMPRLHEIFLKHSGETKVNFVLELEEIKKLVHLNVDSPAGVQPSQEFFESLYKVFGDSDFVEFKAAPLETKAEPKGQQKFYRKNQQQT